MHADAEAIALGGAIGGTILTTAGTVIGVLWKKIDRLEKSHAASLAAERAKCAEELERERSINDKERDERIAELKTIPDALATLRSVLKRIEGSEEDQGSPVGKHRAPQRSRS